MKIFTICLLFVFPLFTTAFLFWLRRSVRNRPCEKRPTTVSAEPPPPNDPEEQCAASSAVAPPLELTEGPTWKKREETRRKQYRDLLVILRQNPDTRWEELEELGFENSFWGFLREDECAHILRLARDESIIRPALLQGTTGMVYPKNSERFLRSVPEGENGTTSRILAKLAEYFVYDRGRVRSIRSEFCHWAYLYEEASLDGETGNLPNATVIRRFCSTRIMEIAESRYSTWALAQTILCLPEDCPEQKLLAEKLALEGHFSEWYELALKLRAETRREDPWFLALAERMVGELDQTFQSALQRLNKSKHESTGIERLLRIAMVRIATTEEAVSLFREIKDRTDVPGYWRRKVQRIALYRARMIHDWCEIPWEDLSYGHTDPRAFKSRALAKCDGKFEEWWRLLDDVLFRYKAVAFEKATREAKTLEQWIELYHLLRGWERQIIQVEIPAYDILGKIKTCPTSYEEARLEYLKNQSYPELAEALSERVEQAKQQDP